MAIIKALKLFFDFIRDTIYSLIYFKTFKVYFCNHLTIGIKYLKEQNTLFPHPVGIVLGKKVRVGKNCIIYQNVTIGTKETKNFLIAPYPVVEDNVTIFANSVIFGDITIGTNSVIGAGSVVFESVPANCIVAGNPAKIIRYKADRA
jgi:serine O-acetyltransferase